MGLCGRSSDETQADGETLHALPLCCGKCSLEFGFAEVLLKIFAWPIG
jgi:hypothetical protein